MSVDTLIQNAESRANSFSSAAMSAASALQGFGGELNPKLYLPGTIDADGNYVTGLDLSHVALPSYTSPVKDATAMPVYEPPLTALPSSPVLADIAGVTLPAARAEPVLDIDGLFAQVAPSGNLPDFTEAEPDLNIDDLVAEMSAIAAPVIQSFDMPVLSALTLSDAPTLYIPDYDAPQAPDSLRDPVDYAEAMDSKYQQMLPEMQAFIDDKVAIWISQYAPEYDDWNTALQAKVTSLMDSELTTLEANQVTLDIQSRFQTAMAAQFSEEANALFYNAIGDKFAEAINADFVEIDRVRILDAIHADFIEQIDDRSPVDIEPIYTSLDGSRFSEALESAFIDAVSVALPASSTPVFTELSPVEFIATLKTELNAALVDSFPVYGETITTPISESRFTDALDAGLGALVDARFNEALAEPLLDGVDANYMAIADASIHQAMDGEVLPAQFEANFITRARGRVERDFNAAEQGLLLEYSKRGFFAPPGALMSGLHAGRLKAAEALANQSADVYSKSIDIDIERRKMELQHTQFVIGIKTQYLQFLRGLAEQRTQLVLNLKVQHSHFIAENKISYTQFMITTDDKRIEFLSTLKEQRAQFLEDIQVKQAQFIANLEVDYEKLMITTQDQRAQFIAEINDKYFQFATDLKSRYAQFVSEKTAGNLNFTSTLEDSRVQFIADMRSKYLQFTLDTKAKYAQTSSTQKIGTIQAEYELEDKRTQFVSDLKQKYAQFVSSLQDGRDQYMLSSQAKHLEFITQTEVQHFQFIRDLEVKHSQFAMSLAAEQIRSVRSIAINYAETIYNTMQQVAAYATNIADKLGRVFDHHIARSELAIKVMEALNTQYEVKLKAALSGLEGFKLELAAEQAKKDVEIAQIKFIEARIGAQTQEVQRYSALIEAITKKADLEELKLKGYSIRADIFRSQTQAKLASFDAYKAALEGDKAKMEGEMSKIEVYKALISTDQLNLEAQIKAIGATTAHNDAKVKVFESAGEVYKLDMEAAIQKFTAQAEVKKLMQGIYGQELSNAIESFRVNLDIPKIMMEAVIKEYELKVKTTIEEANLDIERMRIIESAMSSAASTSASVAASAIGSLNTMVSQATQVSA